MSNSLTFPLTPGAPRSTRIKVQVTGLLALLTSCWAILMFVSLSPYKFDHDFHDEIDSPVLAVELANSAQALQAVLQTSNPNNEQSAKTVLRINNRLDLIFIPLYSGFLWFFADLISTERRGANRYLRFACFICIVGAAVFDYLEDWGISRTLNSTQLTDSLVRATRLPSLVKWGLIGSALFLTSILLLRAAPVVYSLATTRLLGVLYGAAGALMIFGLVRYLFIGVAMKIFSFVVIVNAAGLLGPIVMHHFPGVEPVYIPNFCERRKLALTGASSAIRPRHLKPPGDDLPPSD
jgi:hypothetical protein